MLKSRFYILIISIDETPFILTYTNDQGQRRIRLFNQRYQTTETYPRFFKGIDGTAIAMSLARTASIQSDTIPLTEVRGNLQDTVEEILTQYRAQCSASSSTGQLVLPENGKFLPLWLNCLLKSPLLLLNEQGKRDVLSVVPRGDIRAWAFQVTEIVGILEIVYPTVFSESVLASDVSYIVQTGPSGYCMGDSG